MGMLSERRITVLYHFSEDPTIAVFRPRGSAVDPSLPPLVWAIDATHAPLYYFPRDCPRVAFWKPRDRALDGAYQLFGPTSAALVIAVEGRWLTPLRETQLFIYTFADAGFRCTDSGAGYYVSEHAVVPESMEPAGDLLARLAAAAVELRIVPDLHPLHDAVMASPLQFSMIRMRNAVRGKGGIQRGGDV